MSPAAVIGIVVGVVVVAAIIGFVVSYNRFQSQRNLIAESWRQIDVELQRRFDLIPNLIETVKGYAAHEKTVIEEVTAARTRAGAAQTEGPAARQEPEGLLGRALGGLFAVAEAYPELKASANFLELQKELALTEDRIAAGRRFYNGNVRAYNTRIQTVPSNIVASVFKFTPAEYFEIDDPEARKPVKVQF
jgi:LemA protein